MKDITIKIPADAMEELIAEWLKSKAEGLIENRKVSRCRFDYGGMEVVLTPLTEGTKEDESF